MERIMSRKWTGEIVALKDSYGFICDHEKRSRWFHATYVKGVAFDDLQLGDRVEFTPFVGPRGYRAEDIKVLGRSHAKVA